MAIYTANYNLTSDATMAAEEHHPKKVYEIFENSRFFEDLTKFISRRFLDFYDFLWIFVYFIQLLYFLKNVVIWKILEKVKIFENF